MKIIQFELTKDYLERLKEAIELDDIGFIKNSLKEVNHVDISSILDELETPDAKFILDLLPVEVGAEILNDLDDDIQEKFLKEFNVKEIAGFIDQLDSDDGVDLLHLLPLKEREQVLSHIANEEKQKYLLDLLRYEEDCAGGLMAKELIKANLNWNVVQCIEEIRRQAEKVEKIYSVYVVDDEDKLLGRVSLKKIILSNDTTRIAAIYDEDIHSVPTFVDEEEVAAIMQKYDLDAIPVVNLNNRLLGRITIDDIVDVITENIDEERQLMAGISADVEEDDSIWAISKARLPWLVVGIVGGMISARFMGLFESDIMAMAAVAFFIPLIQATGGNVGIQSSSIVVQTLANRSAFTDPLMKRLGKVLIVAIFNGLALSLLVYLGLYLMNQPMELAGIVSFALFCVVIVASLMGTVTPLLLDKAGINPALASGPFITTTNDIIGLAIYFLVIHWLL